jgi:hypothetical protein
VNSELATAVAYRPEDGRRMAENHALNDFAAALRHARWAYPVEPLALEPPVLEVYRARSRVRLRLMNIAITRVTVRLHGAGVR